MAYIILSLLFYVMMVGVNALANIIPINGQTTGEISNKLAVLVTPASYAFMIWGVIYILLAIWLARGFMRKHRALIYSKTNSILFVLTCILNAGWILVWHYELFALSVAVILLLLLTLLFLYKAIKAASNRLFDIFPFSIYIGWISVASIVNISYYVTYIGLNVTDPLWTVSLLAMGGILGIFFRIFEKDWAYSLVIIWAYLAIAIKNWSSAQAVSYSALFISLLLLILVFIPFKKKRT
ncbi:tryptophan-rich sensory protein [Niallia sp. FSL R7-0271]|uniref:tryptophan-rich sensory protein n=1 Tax=Niallia sp. FSL R7-0271 TaxID=2921678 RepID=UPI0030F72F84